jgi:hypothetical protein
MDWRKWVNPSHTKSGDSNVANVAFGWGDKGFYLETKTWDELKFSTAFKAVFYLGSSAMHVSFHKKLRETASCRKICVSKESYLKLVALYVAILGLVIQLHIFTTYGMGLDWLCVAIGVWLSLYALCIIKMVGLVWRSMQVKKLLKQNMDQNQNFYDKL